jgi:hypothetical protein
MGICKVCGHSMTNHLVLPGPPDGFDDPCTKEGCDCPDYKPTT